MPNDDPISINSLRAFSPATILLTPLLESYFSVDKQEPVVVQCVTVVSKVKKRFRSYNPFQKLSRQLRKTVLFP